MISQEGKNELDQFTAAQQASGVRSTQAARAFHSIQMDIYDHIRMFCDDHAAEMVTRLNETGDQIAEVKRLEGLLEAEFPDLPADTSPRHIAEAIVGEAVADAEMRRRGTDRRHTFSIVPTSAELAEGATAEAARPTPEPEVTATSAPKATPAAKVMSLAFRLVQDERLSLTDRIVFSLAWKWAYCNRRRRKLVSIAKYRRATGFRSATIKASLQRLVAYGYVCDDHEPLVSKDKSTYTLNNGVKYLGHRKVEWLNDGDIRRYMFLGLWHTNRKEYQSKPAWLSKALGVSRRTAFRYIKSLRGTDGTRVGTDGT